MSTTAYHRPKVRLIGKICPRRSKRGLADKKCASYVNSTGCTPKVLVTGKNSLPKFNLIKKKASNLESPVKVASNMPNVSAKDKEDNDMTKVQFEAETLGHGPKMQRTSSMCKCRS